MTAEELAQYEPRGGWRPPRRLFALPPVARGPMPGDAGLEAERQRFIDWLELERAGVAS